MTIENRNLEAGTKLVGRYKKQDHFAEVVKGEDESIVYRLSDGREFKSPSAAGSAIIGGVACNGWRFWSLAGQESEPEPRANGKKGRPKKQAIIRPMDNQEGVSEGQVRWWCNACMDSFIVEGDEAPESCPAGHKAEPSLSALPQANSKGDGNGSRPNALSHTSR